MNLVGVMSLVVDSNVYIIIIRASVDRDGKGEISRDPGTKRLKLIRTFSRPRENLLIRDFSRFSCHHNSSSPLNAISLPVPVQALIFSLNVSNFAGGVH